MEFERSVDVKLRQMKQREGATDRPSRGAPVELSAAAGCRRLRRCGLHCTCALEIATRFSCLAATSLPPRCTQTSVTNVPLSASPGSVFMWSFDRVCAGSAYVEAAVVPVLHRYNDAKYVWSDAVAREWLHGLVRSRGGRAAVIGGDVTAPIALD